jgi:hypothetical protein
LGLTSTYFIDPYVFGFTAVGMMWLAVFVAPCGLVAALVSSRLTVRRKAVILTSVLLGVVAILVALEVLRGFSWA